jgi:hypothetical protein
MFNNFDEESCKVTSEESIICTLFEGHYHHGLAALINSLVANGFRGSISAGYRGALPPWISQLTSLDSDSTFQVCPGVHIKFILLDTPVHFTNFKPRFIQQLIRDHSDCRYIWYFDPDITIRCAWSFYAQWVKYGISLCEDVTNGTMPSNHPIRCRWIELASKIGLENPTILSRYYNGGFIGLPTKYENILGLWQDVIALAESEGTDPRSFGAGGRTNPFYGADQDALNIAAMYCDRELTTIGPEGMDLVPGGFTMFHAMGSPKPWRKNMILSALKGVPPSGADKAFLAHLENPIRIYSGIELAARRISCRIGSLIGRFYRRN